MTLYAIFYLVRILLNFSQVQFSFQGVRRKRRRGPSRHQISPALIGGQGPKIPPEIQSASRHPVDMVVWDQLNSIMRGRKVGKRENSMYVNQRFLLYIHVHTLMLCTCIYTYYFYLTSPGPSEIGHNSFISQPILKPLRPVDSL